MSDDIVQAGSPPNTVSRPTFGHPWCDRCGAVLVEPVERHLAEHVRVDERLNALEELARKAGP